MLNIWNTPLKYLVFLFILIINSQVFAEQTHSITLVNNSSESITLQSTDERMECIENHTSGTITVSPGAQTILTFTDSNNWGGSCYYSWKEIQYFISSPNLFKERNSIFWEHKSHNEHWTSSMNFNSSPSFNTWQFKCNNTLLDASNCDSIDGDAFTGIIYINNPVGTNPKNITGNVLNLANTNKYPKVAGATNNCTFDPTFTNVITSGGNYVLNAQVLQPFGLFKCGMGYQSSQNLPESTTPILGAYTDAYSFNNLVGLYTKPMTNSPNIHINESINTTDQNNFKYNVCINNDYSTSTIYATKYTYVDNLNKCFIGCSAAGNGFTKAYKINHMFKNNTKTSNLTNTMRLGSNNMYSNPFNLQKLIDMSTKPSSINSTSNNGQCSASIQINISNFNGVLLESMLSASSNDNQGNPQLSNINCNESTCIATLNFNGFSTALTPNNTFNTFITLANGNQKVKNVVKTSCTPFANLAVLPNYIDRNTYSDRCEAYIEVKTNLDNLTQDMIVLRGDNAPHLQQVSCQNGTCSAELSYGLGNHDVQFTVLNENKQDSYTIHTVCNRAY